MRAWVSVNFHLVLRTLNKISPSAFLLVFLVSSSRKNNKTYKNGSAVNAYTEAAPN